MIPTDGQSMVPIGDGSLEIDQHALLEPGRLFGRILDVLEALVVVLDQEGRIVLLNEACEQAIGRAGARVLGERFVEVLVPSAEQAEVQLMLDRVLTEPTAHRIENLWIGDHAQRRIRWSVTRITGTGDVPLGGVVTGVDVTREQELEREVVSADEEIRQQFGAELHDMLASHLAGTAMMASALTRKAEKGEAASADDLQRLTGLIRDAMEQVRALSHSFVAPELESEDLVEALDQLASRTEAASGVSCSCSVGNMARCVAPTGATAKHLYRIAQEAFHNAVTHADPSHIDVSLTAQEDPASGTALVLMVRDDGEGMSAKKEEGVGLRNMRRRADLVNASLEMATPEEGGTTIRCVLPLSLPEALDG